MLNYNEASEVTWRLPYSGAECLPCRKQLNLAIWKHIYPIIIENYSQIIINSLNHKNCISKEVINLVKDI